MQAERSAEAIVVVEHELKKDMQKSHRTTKG
jgi:hypothetical protein